MWSSNRCISSQQIRVDQPFDSDPEEVYVKCDFEVIWDMPCEPEPLGDEGAERVR